MIYILFVINFVMLVVVIAAYVYNSMRERKFLRQEAGQNLVLQQKVYQAEVLKEINDRIGYSLDTNKIVEIITNSLGNLLEYDTVSYMVLGGFDQFFFNCHVQNTVSHEFIEEVKEKILLSYGTLLNIEIKPHKIEESITGNILDDALENAVASFFNLPVVISGKLIGIINVASVEKGRYGQKQASILYTITNQAAIAVSKLQSILETEKGRISGVVYSLTDGVITVSLDNKIIVSNPAIKRILQIPDEKELTMFDIVDGMAGKLDIRTKIEQSLLEDKSISLPVIMLKDKAIELTITPVKDNLNEKIGATVVFHDITTEKSLEKLRQEFTAMMVHELRAPLTAVRWSSESLIKNLSAANGMEPSKIKDTAVTIEAASINMLELVNDLLDVAKIEAGKFELNIQEYDLVEVVRDQVKIFQSQVEMKHLSIVFTAPEKFKMAFDRVRIAQVLGNLISNAIKYTDSGHIEININIENAQKAIVSVKDSGIGVARENLNELFSKFKQLNSSDPARKGTGLGLVVSKGIIEAHGGEIWAESAGENLGSTFNFSLPIVNK